jgi:hypothetical protein
MRGVKYVARMVAMRNAYKVLVGKAEKERTLEKPRRRWEENIRMDAREMGWEVIHWIRLA